MDCCWSWNSNTLATSCEELTHWKRPWSWEGLEAGGEGDNRGWDGWMASPTWWTWVWVDSESWWWTGRPGVLQSMGSQWIRHNWVTELNWTELKRNESGSFVDTWMNQSVIQSEVNQKWENNYHILVHNVESRKWCRWTYFQGRNRDADIENEHVNIGVRGRRSGLIWEIGIDTYNPTMYKVGAKVIMVLHCWILLLILEYILK